MELDATDTLHLTAVIYWQEEGYVAYCAELDVASQGDTLEEAKAMLTEALELWLEDPPLEDLEERLGRKTIIAPIEVTGLVLTPTGRDKEGAMTTPEVAVGQAAAALWTPAPRHPEETRFHRDSPTRQPLQNARSGRR